MSADSQRVPNNRGWPTQENQQFPIRSGYGHLNMNDRDRNSDEIELSSGNPAEIQPTEDIDPLTREVSNHIAVTTSTASSPVLPSLLVRWQLTGQPSPLNNIFDTSTVTNTRLRDIDSPDTIGMQYPDRNEFFSEDENMDISTLLRALHKRDIEIAFGISLTLIITGLQTGNMFYSILAGILLVTTVAHHAD